MYDKTNNYPILNSYGWFILIINFAFSIINIVTVCVNYPRWEKLSFDYLGVIVGILSILVTVLLGWQIFINISMESKIDKKLLDVKSKLENIIGDKVSEISIEIEDKRHASIVMSLYQSSCSAYILGKYDFALWLALDSLFHYSKITDKEKVLTKNDYKNIIYSLEKCIGSVLTVTFLNEEQLNTYIDCASKLGLYKVAYFLKYKSIANNKNSGNYIMNICSNELDERNIDHTGIDNKNEIFITE